MASIIWISWRLKLYELCYYIYWYCVRWLDTSGLPDRMSSKHWKSFASKLPGHFLAINIIGLICRLGSAILPRLGFISYWNASRLKLRDYILTKILTGLDIALPKIMPLSKKEQGVQRKMFAAVKAGDIEQLRRCMDNVSNLVRLRIVSARRNGKTALMLACFRAHLPLVAFLVEECNADIEQAGELANGSLQKYSTCLQCAVAGGSVEIVEYLLGWKARVDRAGMDGWTPLFHACTNDNADIARVLIQHGADVNWKHPSGTVLHQYPFYGGAELMRLLLSHPAVTAGSVEGLSPMKLAIAQGHYDLAQDLLKKIGLQCEPLEKIEFLELQGSEYMINQQDVHSAMNLWKRAMVERLEEGIPKVLTAQPHRAYQFAVEAQTMEELERLESEGSDAVMMHALLVCERILGKHRAFTLYKITEIANAYGKMGQFERCIELKIYSLELRLSMSDNHESRSSETQAIVTYLAELFTWMSYLAMDIKVSHVLLLFEKIFGKCQVACLFNDTACHRWDLFGERRHGDGNGSRHARYAFVKPTLLILKVLCDLQHRMTAAELYSFRSHVYQLVKLNLRRKKTGLSLMHYACFPEAYRATRYCQTPAITSPPSSVVQVLIAAGCDVNSCSDEGNTPLHIAADRSSDNGDVIDMLLEAGAHVDSVNNEGQTPRDLLAAKTKCRLQALGKSVSLKCLAARVIRRHELDYQNDHLPQNITDFINQH